MGTRADEVMSRLKGRRKYVAVKSVKGEPVWARDALRRPGADPAAVERALGAVRDAFKGLTRSACAIACDDQGRPLRGSVVVVAAVETNVDTDSVLL